MKRLAILGSGGFAREVQWLVKEINDSWTGQGWDPRWDLVGFIDPLAKEGTLVNGVMVYSSVYHCILLPDMLVAGIGDPDIRRHVVGLHQHDWEFATLIHPNVRYDEDTVKFGVGTVVCAGSILTVNIKVGNNVLINLDCTVGHDCVIEDFATLSPGAHVSGNVHVGEGAYLGTGCAIIEKKTIGAEAVVGAGAVVTKNVLDKTTVVGVPAKPI
jgi:sugar O-acyltransferase (sialic acid O-acetyltransferase NeuD family)